MIIKIAKSLIVLSLISKLLLLDKGARSIPDEYFYNYSIFFIEKISTGNISEATTQLFSTGRPLSTIINIFPATIQGLLYLATGIDPRYPLSVNIPLLFNFGIYILLLFQFHKLIYLITKSKLYGLTGVLLFTLCVNNTIYVRHLLPYDMALLFYISGLLIALETTKSNSLKANLKWQYALCGIIAACCFASYPGYHLINIGTYFILISPVIFEKQDRLKRLASISFYFTIGFLLIIFLLEVSSFAGKVTYLTKLTSLSQTITQGDFDDGYKFAWQYFYDIEKGTGLILIFIFVTGFIYNLLKLIKKQPFNLSILILQIALLITFLYQVWQSSISHNMVFYGRLLHVYYPTLIICVFVFDVKIFQQVPLLLYLTVFVCIYSYMEFYLRYRNIVYPLDIINKIDINSTKCKYVDGMEPAIHYVNYHKDAKQSGLLLRNFSFFISPYELKNDSNSYSNQLLFKGLHFLNMEAYQYEGITKMGRSLIKSHPIYLTVSSLSKDSIINH